MPIRKCCLLSVPTCKSAFLGINTALNHIGDVCQFEWEWEKGQARPSPIPDSTHHGYCCYADPDNLSLHYFTIDVTVILVHDG